MRRFKAAELNMIAKCFGIARRSGPWWWPWWPLQEANESLRKRIYEMIKDPQKKEPPWQ